MSLNSGRISLFSHLESNWTKTSIVFQGDNAGDDYVKTPDPWLYTFVMWSDEFLKTINGPNTGVYITPGVMAFKLYVRVEDGFAKVDQLTDSLFAVFRAKTVDNITFNSLKINRDGDDGKWYLRNLAIGFGMRTLQTTS